MKEKGLVFTLDALFAVSLIILASATIYFTVYQETSGATKGLEFIRYDVADNTMMGFYLHETAADRGLSTSPDFLDKMAYCDRYYHFDGAIERTNLCQGVR